MRRGERPRSTAGRPEPVPFVPFVRMFVAAWPDAETRERLAGLDLSGEKGLRPVGPDRWHVTLRFLGEVDETLVPGLSDVLRNAAGAVPGPVRCHLGPATAWFTGVRVLQLPAAGLDTLAAAVREATLPLVPTTAQDGPPFNGHLTLARAKGRRRAAPVARRLAGIPFDATFVVDRVELVSSVPTPNGHLYATLAEAALRSGPGSDPDV